MISDMNNDLKWEPNKEDTYLSIKEPINWLSSISSDVIDKTTLDSFIDETTIDFAENAFCPSNLMDLLITSKKKLFNGDFTDTEIYRSRMGSNPFESIGKGIFLNRSAMKMSNIDAAFDFMFTNQESDTTVTFADICGGPGGFSEYVLWRCKINNRKVKGFGITLKGDLDFHNDRLNPVCNSFDIHYGYDGDGNVYSPANLSSFKEHVLKSTSGLGVDFVMSDGSFFIEGERQHLDQELLHRRLYLCQFLACLSVLRSRGNFICKLFDTLTPFTISLIFLMYRCFDSICLFKPNTSRPATSEKYIVCKGKKEKTNDVLEFLVKVNNSWQDKEFKILVNRKIIMDDKRFTDFLLKSNTESVKRQIFFLNKMHSFALCPFLRETRQNSFRLQCLNQWKIPVTQRKRQTKKRPWIDKN
jgi:cap1 methyltransferase